MDKDFWYSVGEKLTKKLINWYKRGTFLNIYINNYRKYIHSRKSKKNIEPNFLYNVQICIYITFILFLYIVTVRANFTQNLFLKKICRKSFESNFKIFFYNEWQQNWILCDTNKREKKIYNIYISSIYIYISSLSPGSQDLCNLYQLSPLRRRSWLGNIPYISLLAFLRDTSLSPVHRAIGHPAGVGAPRGIVHVVRLVQLRWGWIKARGTVSRTAIERKGGR